MPFIYIFTKNKTVTCHDVLAIRVGLGYTDTYFTATKSGEFLQKIILSSLSGAKFRVYLVTLHQLAN
jgi:hypothetical protein